MRWLDLLLNASALLLWLNWRIYRLSTKTITSHTWLGGALRQTEVSKIGSWLSLWAIPPLLVLRATLYRHLGSAINWTAQLNLYVVVLPFHSQIGQRMLFYSFLSFGWFLLKFYVWLLVISVTNRNDHEPGPILKFIRVQLGRVERWPVAVKLALPVLAVMLVWLLVTPSLVSMGIVPATTSRLQTIEHGAVLGLAAYLSATHLLAGLIFLHLLNTYLYLGDYAIWQFVTTTVRRVLKPLWGVRIGKVDLAPVLGLVIIVAAGHFADLGIVQLYERVPRN